LLERVAVLGLLGMIMLSIGVGYARLGFWPILPLAGLEFAALAFALHVTARRADYGERIALGTGQLTLTRRSRQGEKAIVLPAPWTRVELEPGIAVGHPSKLFLLSGRQKELVGGFLVESERQQLASLVKQALAPQTALHS
jgi:uncharacterized membrane protein